MIDFGLSIVAVLIISSVEASKFRSRANIDARNAEQKFKGAALQYNAQLTRWDAEKRRLDDRRLTASTWIPEHIVNCANKVGLKSTASGNFRGWFSSLSLDHLKEFIRNQVNIASNSNEFVDQSLKILSYVSYGIEAIQFADKYTPLELPIHQTVGDLVGSMPFDGAGDLAQALGDAGGLAVAEVLSGIGMVSSVARTGFKIFQGYELIKEASEFDERTKSLKEETGRIERLFEICREDRENLEQLSYVVFRQTIMLEEASTWSDQKKSKVNYKGLVSGYEDTVRAFWENLRAGTAVA